MVAESQFAFKAQEWYEDSGRAPMDLSTMNTGNLIALKRNKPNETLVVVEFSCSSCC